MIRLALAVAAAAAALSPLAAVGQPSFTVHVLRLVDHSRRAYFRNGTSSSRVLVTSVRVPVHGDAPYPLVVFAHGFALDPQVYSRLLDSWARAGFVVAAPAFPVERADAPGGPDERDLVNEPRDLSFVISRLTSAAGPLGGVIDANRIAVAGQSDGAEAALAAAYDDRYLDRRVDAALILSGAAFPGFTRPPPGSPPLLALQGTDDQVNSPGSTGSYYALMRRPKFLVWLLGAPHLQPYTTDDRWAGVVDRATTAFLERYLRGGSLAPLLRAGRRSGVARIIAQP